MADPSDLSNACFYDNCEWCRDRRCECECHFLDEDEDL